MPVTCAGRVNPGRDQAAAQQHQRRLGAALSPPRLDRRRDPVADGRAAVAADEPHDWPHQFGPEPHHQAQRDQQDEPAGRRKLPDAQAPDRQPPELVQARTRGVQPRREAQSRKVPRPYGPPNQDWCAGSHSAFVRVVPPLLPSLTCTHTAVKPDATDSEIKAAWEDSQGGAQIFSQAVRPHFALSFAMSSRTDS